jgi:hypothetical protein
MNLVVLIFFSEYLVKLLHRLTLKKYMHYILLRSEYIFN